MWKRIVFSLLPALGLIVAAELVLRLVDYRSPLEDPYRSFVSRRPLFEPHGDQLRVDRARLRWFHDTTLTRDRAPGTLRGFVAGGSAVYGYRLEDPAGSSFPALLARRLHEELGSDVEIVNCGGLSYASYRLLHIVEEVVDYGPDFVVVMTGHNEFLEPRHYADLMEGKTNPHWYSRLSRLRLVVWARTLGARLRPAPETVETQPIVRNEPYERFVVREDEEVRATLEHLERNLDRMIDVCRARSVPIILVTPPSNLRDHPPFYTVTEIDPARANQLTARIRRRLDQRDFERALELGHQALEQDRGAAVFHYLAARALDGLQRFDEAAREYALARDTDGFPHRATAGIIEILRRTARTRGVPLLDAEAVFREAARDGIPGNDLFFDNCHPTREGHVLIADALADVIWREVRVERLR